MLGHFHHFEHRIVWQKDIYYNEVEFHSFKHLARIIKYGRDAYKISVLLQSTAHNNADIVLVVEQQDMHHKYS